MSNDDTEQLLSFGDFPMVHSTSAGGSGVAQLNVNSPSRHHHRGPSNDDFLGIRTESSHPTASNEGGQGAGDATKTHSFLQFEFYQQFFDVDTLVVLDRIASSIVPKRAATNYLKSVIGDAPDLYGPIWIVITLVFSIAISGNIARYMQQAGSSSTHWHYNFHLVSLAATVIIFYVCGVSTGLWATFKWTLKAVDPNFETDTSSYTPSLLSLLCVYGYSLAIYIPVSILWMIPVGVFEAFVFISLLILLLLAVLLPAVAVGDNRGDSVRNCVGVCAAAGHSEFATVTDPDCRHCGRSFSARLQFHAVLLPRSRRSSQCSDDGSDCCPSGHSS